MTTAHERAEPEGHAPERDRVGDVALELVGGTALSAAAAIYGTILVTAVIAALSEDPAASPLEVASASLLTVVVFWLTHVYANVVGERAATRDRGRWESPVALLIQERPMVGAALIPILPLVIAAAIGVHHEVATNAALVVGVAELFVWGYVAARHAGSIRAQMGSAALLALLGVGVTLLKLLVH